MNAPVFDNRPCAMVLAVLAANLGAQKHDADSRLAHGRARSLVGTTGVCADLDPSNPMTCRDQTPRKSQISRSVGEVGLDYGRNFTQFGIAFLLLGRAVVSTVNSIWGHTPGRTRLRQQQAAAALHHCVRSQQLINAAHPLLPCRTRPLLGADVMTGGEDATQIVTGATSLPPVSATMWQHVIV